MRDHASDDADADFVRGAQAKPLFAKAPAEVRTPPLDLLFITDRTPAMSPDEPEPYTADRSRLMAFRSTTILFGEHTTWDALVKQSLLVERSTSSDLKLGPTKELGRYPRIPYAVAVTPEGLTRAPATVDAHETADRTLQAEIARRLPLSPRKEMVLYIHGVKNTFSDAAFTMGEICHFLGREFVCAMFTWPAGGKRGILFGYQEDYESSIFAVEHLRKPRRRMVPARLTEPRAAPGLERPPRCPCDVRSLESPRARASLPWLCWLQGSASGGRCCSSMRGRVTTWSTRRWQSAFPWLPWRR